MKILILAHDCGLRGAERVVAEEAEELIRRGWNVLVAVPCRFGGLSDHLRGRNIPYVFIRYYGWMGPGRFFGRARRIIGNFAALPSLIVLIKMYKPDFIHVHSIACGIGAIAARLTGIPHIWHLHEPGPYAISADRPRFDLGERASLSVARWSRSRFVAVSNSLARMFERILNIEQVGVVYQSINLNAIVPPDDTAQLARITNWPGRKLIVVGALLLWKDPLTAVRAMSYIVREWPDAGLFFVGPDPIGMGAEIEAVARDLGVSDNVVRLGAMLNAHPAIMAADACIVTAVDEGFGRVQAEAMLSGTPVVSADVPVNREVAGDDNVDFFTPSDPEALAAAISSLFSRPQDEISCRVERALAYARGRFSAEAAANALEIELLACPLPRANNRKCS